jgi:anti-sigma B factor antagonist
METHNRLSLTEQDGVVVAALNAESVSVTELEAVSAILREYITRNRPSRLVFDLSRIRFLSSMTLGLLVDIWRRLKEIGGQMRICGIQPHLMRVFRITHLDRIFEFSPDCDHALHAFRQKP